MNRTTLVIAGLALNVVGVLGLVLVQSGRLPLAPDTNTPEARGAWIYTTGSDPNGQVILSSGGMPMGSSCASCHGANGRGLKTRMFTSPDITYRNLTDAAGMIEPSGERGMTYTDALIQRAVEEGVDADGQPLAWPMPHWQLTDADWSDLLAYLKTLR